MKKSGFLVALWMLWNVDFYFLFFTSKVTCNAGIDHPLTDWEMFFILHSKVELAILFFLYTFISSLILLPLYTNRR